jgi:hypothetical protein
MARAHRLGQQNKVKYLSSQSVFSDSLLVAVIPC